MWNFSAPIIDEKMLIKLYGVVAGGGAWLQATSRKLFESHIQMIIL